MAKGKKDGKDQKAEQRTAQGDSENPRKARAAADQAPAKPLDYSSLEPMAPNKALAEIVGPDKLLHAEANRRVWLYVKRHRLQDTQNPLMINPDEKLKAIVGAGQVSTVQLTKAVRDKLK